MACAHDLVRGSRTRVGHGRPESARVTVRLHATRAKLATWQCGERPQPLSVVCLVAPSMRQSQYDHPPHHNIKAADLYRAPVRRFAFSVVCRFIHLHRGPPVCRLFVCLQVGALEYSARVVSSCARGSRYAPWVDSW